MSAEIMSDAAMRRLHQLQRESLGKEKLDPRLIDELDDLWKNYELILPD